MNGEPKLTTAYVLYCGNCRKNIPLTLQEYQKQLAEPDGWKCPNCGDSDDVVFDEDNYEKITGNKRRET